MRSHSRAESSADPHRPPSPGRVPLSRGDDEGNQEFVDLPRFGASSQAG